MKSRLTAWKTTILGLALLIASLAYVYYTENADKFIFFGMLISGISLLFSPDTYINSLKSLLVKLTSKAEKIEIEDEIN